MSTGNRPKPVFWVRSSRKDLLQLPHEVRKIFGFAIWQAQIGRHLAAKPLKSFGGTSVLEVVEDDDGSTYRGGLHGAIRQRGVRPSRLSEEVEEGCQDAEAGDRADSETP